MVPTHRGGVERVESARAYRQRRQTTDGDRRRQTTTRGERFRESDEKRVCRLLDPVEGHVASESIVCIELVDALAAQRGAVTAPLVPTCPWKASHASGHVRFAFFVFCQASRSVPVADSDNRECSEEFLQF